METLFTEGRALSRTVRAWAAGRTVNMAPHWRADSFRRTEGLHPSLRRALGLRAILERVELPVWPGELIVGIGNPARLGPAGCVEPAVLAADRQCCADVGMRGFTTHVDHHAPDYETLLACGFGGLRARIRESLGRQSDAERRAFLESVDVAIDSAAALMRRYAARLREVAALDPSGRDLLLSHADSMDHLADAPPRTFREALQLVYSYHCMMQHDERYAMAFGRLDQYLFPFYRRDLAAGVLGAEEAQTCLDHLFAKITVDADVQNIAVGGVRPEDGSDATNDLSYMILEACRRIGLPGGNVTARIHKNTPERFIRKCAEVIRSGVGYPAVFNDEIEIPALVDLGYPVSDARDYCFVGCIEVFIPGRTAPWADSRFNLLQCVNLALFGGVDSLTGTRLGPDTGEPPTWEAFFEAFLTQMRARLAGHVEALNAAKAAAQAQARSLTSPLMSALVRDCIERGRDVNDGGARYPGNHGIAGMGIAVTADSLMAIRHFVYECKALSLARLRQVLEADFEGFEAERRMLLGGAPKYGNGIAEVDEIAAEVTRLFGQECLKYRSPTGGAYWALMAANVNNIPAGREVGASPDGRRARQPLSDAASPTFGRDLSGPTAVVRSVSRLPYRFCPGGNVINMKLHPTAIEGEEGLGALAALIRTCFDLGGIELQFNTVDRKVLQEAMARPDEYGDLVVRVSGFSAHYTSLDRAVQEDILARTEHRELAGP